RFDVVRVRPERCHQSEPAELALAVSNPGPRRVVVRVRDALPADLGGAVTMDLAVPPATRETRPFHVVPRRRGEAALPPLTARVLGPWALGIAQRTFGE